MHLERINQGDEKLCVFVIIHVLFICLFFVNVKIIKLLKLLYVLRRKYYLLSHNDKQIISDYTLTPRNLQVILHLQFLKTLITLLISNEG